MALLSHLDLMRLLERSLRRSELPISFSGGFHPLPRIQVALALLLGEEAHGEWMDLKFTEAVEAGRLMEILQPHLPQGIEILSVDEVPVRGKSLSQEISGAEWSFDLILESGGSTDWSEALAAITAAKELIWHDTDKKGRPRQRDCRPAIRRLDCLTDGQGERVRLRLEASVDPMGRSVRPSQIQHWIEKQLSEPLTLRRLSRDGLQLSEC